MVIDKVLAACTECIRFSIASQNNLFSYKLQANLDMRGIFLKEDESNLPEKCEFVSNSGSCNWSSVMAHNRSSNSVVSLLRIRMICIILEQKTAVKPRNDEKSLRF